MISRSDPAATRSLPKLLALNGAIFLGYALLGRLPAALFTHVSPFWPPAALAVFAALVWGWRGMPGIFLGSLWVNLGLLGWTLPGAAWVSLGNVAAPLLGLWGIRDLPVCTARCCITRLLCFKSAMIDADQSVVVRCGQRPQSSARTALAHRQQSIFDYGFPFDTTSPVSPAGERAGLPAKPNSARSRSLLSMSMNRSVVDPIDLFAM